MPKNSIEVSIKRSKKLSKYHRRRILGTSWKETFGATLELTMDRTDKRITKGD